MCGFAHAWIHGVRAAIYPRLVIADSASERFREIAFYLSEDSGTVASVEWLWGDPLGGGLFRILTSPHYVDGISVGDVVETAEAPERHFVALKERSGHSTLRVYIEADVAADAFFLDLEELGCGRFATNQPQYYTLDISEAIPITHVLDYLSRGQDADRCDWDVGSISQTHGRQLRAIMDPTNLPDWLPKA